MERLFKGKDLAFPKKMMENLTLENTIFPENESAFGVAALSGKMSGEHILHLYQLLYSDEYEAYCPVLELASFKFKTHEELKAFIIDLPHISGLEMLFLINPIVQEQDPIENKFLN